MLMSAKKPLDELENPAEFVARHVGIDDDDETSMLGVIGAASRRALIEAIVPASIARAAPMRLPPAAGEAQALAEPEVRPAGLVEADPFVVGGVLDGHREAPGGTKRGD